jgi:hypothetical protein
MHQVKIKVLTKESFYEEPERVIDQFPKYHTKLFFLNFSIDKEATTFSNDSRNETLHEISNDYGI